MGVSGVCKKSIVGHSLTCPVVLETFLRHTMKDNAESAPTSGFA